MCSESAGAGCNTTAAAADCVALDAYTCACHAGWRGPHCRDDIDECAPLPCKNNGYCNDSSTDQTVPVASYRCDCLAGWTDAMCERDVDECANNPCGGTGTCAESSSGSRVAVGEYTCTCEPGYTDNTAQSSPNLDCHVFNPCASSSAHLYCDGNASCGASKLGLTVGFYTNCTRLARTFNTTGDPVLRIVPESPIIEWQQVRK